MTDDGNVPSGILGESPLRPLVCYLSNGTGLKTSDPRTEAVALLPFYVSPPPFLRIFPSSFFPFELIVVCHLTLTLALHEARYTRG